MNPSPSAKPDSIDAAGLYWRPICWLNRRLNGTPAP